MMFCKQLAGDQRGASAIEFAFAAPVILGFLIGILQVGTLAQANTSLSYGLDEAARLAVIYPKPTSAAIETKLKQATNDIDPRKLTFAIAYGTANNVKYADLTATYLMNINFIFFTANNIQLTQRRRVYQSN